MPSRRHTPPIDWLARGGTWPAGPFRASSPRYVHLTAAIAAALIDALDADPRSVRAVARDAEITHPSITRLIQGLGVPDAVTISHLEAALDVDLWPSRNQIASG